jgi:hypothetical protein
MPCYHRCALQLKPIHQRFYSKHQFHCLCALKLKPFLPNSYVSVIPVTPYTCFHRGRFSLGINVSVIPVTP